jgi:DNA replication licensing factor MCM3
MSIVKPMIQTSVHYCEATKKGQILHYNDNTNLGELVDSGNGKQGSNTIPTQDAQGNKLTAEHGYCVYKDSQVVTIQEMPEMAPPGQLPRSIEVILQNDLVEKLKPGDRVEVTGVYRAAPSKSINGIIPGIFRTQIVATGVTSLLDEKKKPQLNDTDIKNIKKLAKDDKCFEILGKSIAPTIHGNL